MTQPVNWAMSFFVAFPLPCLLKMVDDGMMQSSSLIINNVRAAAKQAQDEESLMKIMKKDFLVKSMAPNGDCGYELMCMWKRILHLRGQGNLITKRVLEESVDPQQILLMRNAIAKIQEEEISKGNRRLQNLIGQSMFDWSRSPLENNRRNEEVAAALRSLPAGVQEMDWLISKDALDLHSSLIRNGLHEVFAESPEMEAFSLMMQSPLAIYLPGSCQVYPTSSQCGPNDEYLVGICNGNHFFLAVPKKWIGDHKGMPLISFTFYIGCVKIAKIECFSRCIYPWISANMKLISLKRTRVGLSRHIRSAGPNKLLPGIKPSESLSYVVT